MSIFEAVHAALRGADRALTAVEENDGERRAENEIARFGSPGQPAVVRDNQAEIGAGQEMRWVVRIDRDDQRDIEEQADIGPQPRPTEIA